MENNTYVSPELDVIEIQIEGVLCQSGTEDLDLLGGEWS